MERIIEIDYKPFEKQRVIHQDRARYRVIVTGRRFGKTTLAVNECVKLAWKSDRQKIWYIAPTYRQAKMIAYELFKKYIPKEFLQKANEVDLEFFLKNGSRISLKGADNEDSLRGVGLNFVILDEFSMMKVNVWQEIVRPMLTDTLGSAMFIGTPKGKNHFWELWMKGIRKEDGYSSYSFKTEDNPIIPREEIEEARKQVNDRYFKQEYEASFEDYTGLIWPEFTQKSVIEPLAIPPHWESVGAIDTALSGTTAVLIGVFDEDGSLYVTSEYYEQNKRVSEISDSIREKAKSWLIDPASKIRTSYKQGELYSLYNEYADNGIHPRPAENDVTAGINRVGEYFKQGKIKIFNTCKNLLNELERYHWAEERETVSGVTQPKPYKSMDHACDCLRYLVMSRQQSEKQPKEPTSELNQATFEHYEKKQHEEYEEAVA